MDHNLTKQIQSWLDQPASERDYNLGLTFLLKLSNNQIMCRNLERDPASKADFIEYQIRKYQSFRLKQMTHDEVEQMRTQVDRIAQSHNLLATVPSASAEGSSATVPTASPESKSESFRAGKRPDHDLLPVEIQALYVENADIIHKMRDLHVKLRSLSLENVTCPDSERYPFLKEIIDLDKRYHKNWQIYDHFNANAAPASVIATVPEESTSAPSATVPAGGDDSRMEQKQIYRQINLTKGRYKKAPSDDLKSKIVALYNQLTSPVASLTDDLITLGILNPE